MEATGVISWPRVTAELVFRGWVGVAAEVSGLKGGLGLHAGVTARLDFRDTSEDVIEAKAVPYLVDHGVGVSRNAVDRWVQDDATCKGKTKALDKLATLLPDSGIPQSMGCCPKSPQSSPPHDSTALAAVTTFNTKHQFSRMESQNHSVQCLHSSDDNANA